MNRLDMDGAAAMPVARWLRLAGRLLTAMALIVLAVAYAAMSWEHGTLWLWQVVVHEDGRRTFAQTLFYFEHATRELPLDLLLGLAVGAGAAAALGRAADAGEAESGQRRPLGLLFALLACILLMIGATAWQLGADAVGDNLLQYHTRAGAPLVWGAHWRYHLLERGPLILLALGLSSALVALRRSKPEPRAEIAGWTVLAMFLGLTALFTPDLAALAEPFTDPRFLGHQIRESFTHGLVTLPLALGLVLARWRGGAEFGVRQAPRLAWSLGAVGLALGLIAYVLVAAIAADAAAQGQSESLTTLLAPHFFEHGFTYLVTPLTAVLVFEAMRAWTVPADPSHVPRTTVPASGSSAARD